MYKVNLIRWIYRIEGLGVRSFLPLIAIADLSIEPSRPVSDLYTMSGHRRSAIRQVTTHGLLEHHIGVSRRSGRPARLYSSTDLGKALILEPVVHLDRSHTEKFQIMKAFLEDAAGITTLQSLRHVALLLSQGPQSFADLIPQTLGGRRERLNRLIESELIAEASPTVAKNTHSTGKKTYMVGPGARKLLQRLELE